MVPPLLLVCLPLSLLLPTLLLPSTPLALRCLPMFFLWSAPLPLVSSWRTSAVVSSFVSLSSTSDCLLPVSSSGSMPCPRHLWTGFFHKGVFTVCLAYTCPPARHAARGSALRGLLAALLVALLLLVPRYAYASYTSDAYGIAIYGPVDYEWQGETHHEVGYVAPNRYNAAAYACGYTESQVNSWGSDDGSGLDGLAIRAKLSNASTGGAFYELAQSFIAPSPDDWVPVDAGPTPGFWAWAYTVYGEGNLWYCDDYTDSDVAAARAVVESILGGGSGGGSGGGGESGDIVGDVTINGVEYKLFHTSDVPEGYYQRTRGYYGVAVSVPYLNALVTALADNNITDAKLWIAQSDTAEYGRVTVAAVGVEQNWGGTSTGGVDPFFTWAAWPDRGSYVNFGYRGVRYPGTYTADNGDKYMIANVNASGFGFGTGIGVQDAVRPVYSYYYGELSGGGSDVPPENDWPEPDDPVVPTPPNPDPPSNPRPGTPTLPKPTNPTQPVNVNVTVTTPVSDILDALNKIIQELENHCVHLQNKMVECAKYLGECLIQVRDGIIDAINEGMEYDGTLHDDLMSYLEELFGWMRDNLNFDLTVTNAADNTEIVDWLKRIYVQDGTGYTNARPIDITQNYDGYGDWVGDIVGYMLPDLRDTNLAPVTTAFDALDDKFPFSVPNDLLRIFQSFDSQAVTPVIRLTIPSVLGISSYTYVFDLSPYNSAMQTIRAMELIAFVTFLLVWARRALTTEAVGVDD